MTLTIGRIAVAGLCAALAGGWLGLSLLGPSRAAQVPGGAMVRRLNRDLGQWLLDRSTPLPDCPQEGGGAAAAAGQARAGGAAEAREAVEGLYRWTDQKGVTHFTDEEERVPEPHRAGSKVRTLPLLTVYRGEYSRLPGGAPGCLAALPLSRRRCRAPRPRAPERARWSTRRPGAEPARRPRPGWRGRG